MAYYGYGHEQDPYWQHLHHSLGNQETGKFADDSFGDGPDFYNFEQPGAAPSQQRQFLPPPPLQQQPPFHPPRSGHAPRGRGNRAFQHSKRPSPGKKRSAASAGLPANGDNSRAAKILRATTGTKTSISILNEAGVSPAAFEFGGQSGQDHQPIFRCSVTVDGVIYSAVGNTKKAAKECAAKAAIEAITSGSVKSDAEQMNEERDVRTSEDSEAAGPTVAEESRMAVSVDADTLPGSLSTAASTSMPSLVAANEMTGQRVLEHAHRDPAVATKSSSAQGISSVLRGFNPIKIDALKTLLLKAYKLTSLESSVQLVHQFLTMFGLKKPMEEYAPQGVQAPNSKRQCFGWKLSFFDEEFTATGPTKMTAKRKLSTEVLNWALDIIPIAWRMIAVQAELNSYDQYSGQSQEDSTSRRFAALVCYKSYELFDEFNLKHAGSEFARHFDQDHMAAVMMFRNNVLVPVSLACGSSVIYRKNLDVKGMHLKDCQAEILAVRAARPYLLNEVRKFHAKESSIFGAQVDGKLELQKDIGFHLYISRPPSGSCSVGSTIAGQATKLLLSSIVGEFVAPNLNRITPSIDVRNIYYDIREGEQKLHIMSSSDKLMKRTTTGIQGSLLSCLMRPIFFETATLRGHFDMVAVASGIYHRILPAVSAMPALPHDCGIVCPEVCRTEELTSSESFTIKRKDDLTAFVWGCGDDAPWEELLNTSTGLVDGAKPSRLCKKSFADGFLAVAAATAREGGALASMDFGRGMEYGVLKKIDSLYQKRLSFFRELLKLAGLGNWIEKCPEEDSFDVGPVMTENTSTPTSPVVASGSVIKIKTVDEAPFDGPAVLENVALPAPPVVESVVIKTETDAETPVQEGEAIVDGQEG